MLFTKNVAGSPTNTLMVSANTMIGNLAVVTDDLRLVNLVVKTKLDVIMHSPFANAASNGVSPVGVSTILHR